MHASVSPQGKNEVVSPRTLALYFPLAVLRQSGGCIFVARGGLHMCQLCYLERVGCVYVVRFGTFALYSHTLRSSSCWRLLSRSPLAFALTYVLGLSDTRAGVI
jgi:hypothetical protein